MKEMKAEIEKMQTRLEKLLGYLSLDSDNYALLSDASDLALQCHDWEKARELVGKMLVLRPEDGVARYRMAIILLNAAKAEESLVLTQELLDAGETHSAIRFAHARGLAMTSRFSEADAMLSSLLQDAADFPEFPYLYVRVLHHLGKIKEAISVAENFLKIHPQDGVLQGMASLLYLDNDDVQKAAEFSAVALQIEPNNIDALVTAGSAALAYEREGEAKDCFDRAISLYAENGRAWAGLGLVNMLKLDLPVAQSNFENATRYMPGHLGSYNALAWIQILQRDYAGAKKTLQASIEVNRNFGETYGGLAVIAAMEGNWEEAERLADTAVRLQRESFSGRFAQSLIMAHRGHPERARHFVDSLLKNAKVFGGKNLADTIASFVSRRNSH